MQIRVKQMAGSSHMEPPRDAPLRDQDLASSPQNMKLDTGFCRNSGASFKSRGDRLMIKRPVSRTAMLRTEL